MTDLRLTLETRPDPADSRTVMEGLLAFNLARIGEPREEQVAIFVRDADERVVGGLLGHMRWRWLYVAKLWLPDELRGHGLGTRLMRMAEEHAVARGCTHAHLDTFEYQARPFYEKLGYAVVGQLDGFPPGYRQYFMARELVAADPPAAEMPTVAHARDAAAAR